MTYHPNMGCVGSIRVISIALLNLLLTAYKKKMLAPALQNLIFILLTNLYVIAFSFMYIEICMTFLFISSVGS